MKKLTILSISVLLSVCLYSQSNKWDLNGNTSGTNDFIGTTNNQALVFKTDNTVRLKISPTGNVIVKDLESTGIGLVKANDNGRLGKIDFPNNSTYVFDGTGNFTPIINLVGWSVNTNYVTVDASKKVGIGIPNPTRQFEVLGDSKFHGSLYVRDSIQIGDSSIHIYSCPSFLCTPLAGNHIYTDPQLSFPGGQLQINCRPTTVVALNPNTIINSVNGRVGIGAGGPAAKLTVKDGANNNLSTGADYLNGNVGVMVKCHRDLSMPNTASNLSFGANEFRFYADAHTTPDVVIKADGRVGIGTSTPANKLTVKDLPDNNLCVGANWLNGNVGILLNSHNDAGNAHVPLAFASSEFHFHGGAVKIGDVSTPNVGVSGTVDGYRLYVEHGILTERVKVAVKTSTDWADYVFSDDYELLSLDSVGTYIESNNHLPGVPSSEEMVSNGNDLGKTDKILLEKIENLYLYVIQLSKEIELLKLENKKLKESSTDEK